jgi:hypothetical protein
MKERPRFRRSKLDVAAPPLRCTPNLLNVASIIASPHDAGEFRGETPHEVFVHARYPSLNRIRSSTRHQGLRSCR